MKVFSTIHFILLFIISTDIFAQNITGEWFTKNQDAKVKLYQCQNKICGDIVWLKDPLWSEKEAKTLPNIKAGEIKTDIHNPDKSLKTKKIIGSQLLVGLSTEDNILWEGGTIYDAESGKTYSCKAEMLDNGSKLKLTGYIGFSWLGRSVYWQKVKSESSTM